MNDHLFEKAKEYFSGNMSHEEKLLFETEMKSNKELAAMCELYKTIEEGIDGTGEYNEQETLLRNSLKNLHQQYLKNESSIDTDYIYKSKENSKVKNIKHGKRLAVAGIVIGVISISTIWFLKKKDVTPVITQKSEKSEKPNPERRDTANKLENNNLSALSDTGKQKTFSLNKSEREALYSNNFKKDTIPSDIPEHLQEALNHYKSSEYKNTIAAIDVKAIQSALEDLRPRGETTDMQDQEESKTIFYAHYYKGLSYMADMKPESALPELQSALTKSPDKLWKSKVQWYLALAYLKAGKVAKAENLFKKIATTGSYKKSAAAKILSLLKEK